jgi:hypothetical protein
MSDAEFSYEDEAVDQQPKDPVRAHLRKLEAENKELRALRAQAETAQKELAFAKAGLDLSSKMAQYFVKGYDGELTPEAIQAAAAEANLIPNANKELASEQQAWNRVSQAQRNGETSEPVVDYASKISQAKSPDEVMQLLAQARAEASNL